MVTRDGLTSIFELREEYMRSLVEHFPGCYPEWPIDISSKSNQKLVRDITLRGVEEMFEAIFLLKNHKDHRATELPELDLKEFLEEYVDALNYFLSVLVLIGVDEADLMRAYEAKHAKILQRLKDGY